MTLLRLSVLSFVLATVYGGDPQLSFGINSAPEYPGALGAVEPRIQWSGNQEFRGVELEGGLDVQLQDADTMPPINLWGRAYKTIESGWALSGRLDTAIEDSTAHELKIELNAQRDSTSFNVQAAINDQKKASLGQIRLSQSIEGLGGTWTLIPQYHVQKKQGDLTVAYNFQDTVIAIDTSTETPNRLSVTQRIGDNMYSPSVSADGDVELEYRKQIQAGVLTTTLKPNQYLNLRWEEGPWEANLRAPMEGIQFKDAPKLNLRRLM